MNGLNSSTSELYLRMSAIIVQYHSWEPPLQGQVRYLLIRRATILYVPNLLLHTQLEMHVVQG